MVNPNAQISEADIMKHITRVNCRRQINCKNQNCRPACVRCTWNRTGLHIEDNYREKVPGMRFL